MPAADAHAESELRSAALRHGMVGEATLAADFLQRAKAYLVEVRECQLQYHREGGGGEVTASIRSRGIDLLLDALYRRAEGEAAGLTLLALGGYGREALCPHSDIDLLMVVTGDAVAGRKAAEAILYPLWDLGFKMGHAVRTPEEILSLDLNDLHSWIAFLDRRRICGPILGLSAVDAALAKREANEGGEPLLRQLVDAQRARRAKMGGSPFLQEPDLKQGVGALRDLQSIRWLSRLARRAASPADAGLLPPEDARRLDEALSFMLRVRCELHFQSPRPSEILSLERQASVSSSLGHAGTVGERIASLMGIYFSHADHIQRCAKLIEGQVLGDSEPVGEGPECRHDGFTYRQHGVARADHPLVFEEDPLRLIRLFRLCQIHHLIPDRTTSLLVRDRAALLTPELALGPEAQSLFKEILGEAGRVHPTVEALREHGLLSRLLPEFAGLHCLVQLEFYHRWTADIHTLRCLQELDQVFQATEGDAFYHQQVLKSTRDPKLLAITLLLHDIGKAGGIHGHAERGAALAEPILTRLGYAADSRRLVEAVIRHHLVMGIYWQRHDIDDPANIARFAETVGDRDILRHLFVHTRCDARATSPGLWTDGKGEQHNRLLRLTLDWLERGGQSPEATARLTQLRTKVETLLQADVPAHEIEAHFTHLPPSYFLHVDAPTVALHLKAVRAHLHAALGDSPDAALMPQVAWQSHPRGGVDCTIITWDRAGLFAKIAGAFAVAGINILSARAFSRGDDIALDRFRVALPTEGTEEAKARFNQTLAACLVRQEDLQPQVQAEEHRLERRSPQRRSELGQEPVVRAYLSPELAKVVVELQVPDRLGLLFHVGCALRDAGYTLTFANIATERGYALDTFYLVPDPSLREAPEDVAALEARVRAAVLPSQA